MILIDRDNANNAHAPTATTSKNETSSSGMRKFNDVYRIEERLHSGAFGTVYRVTSRLKTTTSNHHHHHKNKNNKSYAVKIIPRAKLRPKDHEDIRSEVAVMSDLKGVENVVQLIDFFAEPDHYYIVQELARGGDLFDRVANGELYSEQETRAIAIKLLRTLQAIHKKGILHRDLKPENILITTDKDKTSILLADFGFATYLPESGFLTRRCGTPNFLSPEVCKKEPYNQSSDLWSLGCILFMCIEGLPPFLAVDKKQGFEKVCKGEFDFHGFRWSTVSVPAKQFLMGLLTVDPHQRWTLDQALNSTWIQSGLTDGLFGTIDWNSPKLKHEGLLGDNIHFASGVEAQKLG